MNIIKDECAPDKQGWSRIGIHKWKHLDGFIIQRMWTLVDKKKDYFLCYVSESDYQKGNNFASFSSLKVAKNSFRG